MGTGAVGNGLSAVLPAEKKRYEWIDNARIVAAFLIMYVHVPLFFPADAFFNNSTISTLLFDTTFRGRVPFFLILAGYFLARNITWAKALDRFIWLFVPFTLWNILMGVMLYLLKQPVSWHGLWGIGSIFKAEWCPFGHGISMPFLSPSWFLRDIMILSLLTPLIIRLKRILPAILVLYAIFWRNNDPNLHIGMNITLAPETCFFYLLGVCLVSFRIDDAFRIFNKRFTPVCAVLLVAAVVFGIWIHHGLAMDFPITLLGMLVGAMMIAHSGVLIEKHLPKLSKMMAPLGPACFLVFMLHIPVFIVIEGIIPKSIMHSPWSLMLPFPTFAFICIFFLLMKKYTPWLMPYLAHMKIKPRKG